MAQEVKSGHVLIMANLDKIYIRDLALRCIIGIYPEERKDLQDILINVTLEADLSHGADSDQIEDTVDYKSICKEIILLVKESEFNLIETLVDRVMKICLSREQVQRATVSIDKPGALRFARSVAVEFTREKSI